MVARIWRFFFWFSQDLCKNNIIYIICLHTYMFDVTVDISLHIYNLWTSETRLTPKMYCQVSSFEQRLLPGVSLHQVLVKL